MQRMILPVLSDTMTVVDGMAKLRQYKSRAGVRSTGFEEYEVLTAADLVAAIDGKSNWKTVRVSAVPHTQLPIAKFQVGLADFKAEFNKRQQVHFAFPVEEVRLLAVAESGGQAAASEPETLTVVSKSERLFDPILAAAVICRCREANHDNVSPPTCYKDGSEVDCT